MGRDLLLTAGAALRSGQAAWGFSGSVFKDWRLQNLSGQSALLGCSHREQISLYVMFSVMAIVFCPPCGAL